MLRAGSLRRFDQIIRLRIDAVGVCTGFELDHARLDALEKRVDIGIWRPEPGDLEDVSAHLHDSVLDLSRLEHDGGRSHEGRAEQTDEKRHEQCPSDRVRSAHRFAWKAQALRRNLLLTFARMTKWSMVGAKILAKRIASMMPSGNAMLTTRMTTVIAPIRKPKTQRPGLVTQALTGSVAMNTIPKAKPPSTRCQYQGMANIGFESEPTALKRHGRGDHAQHDSGDDPP